MSKMKIRVEDGNVIIPVKLLKNIWNTFFSLIFLVICFIAFDYVIAGAGKYTHINPWQWTVPSVTTLLAVNSCAPYASYYSLNVVFNRRFATKRVFICISIIINIMSCRSQLGAMLGSLDLLKPWIISYMVMTGILNIVLFIVSIYIFKSYNDSNSIQRLN